VCPAVAGIDVLLPFRLSERLLHNDGVFQPSLVLRLAKPRGSWHLCVARKLHCPIRMKTAETYVRVPSISLRASLVRERVEAMGKMNVGRLESQLARWGAVLDELVAKTNETATEAKSDLHKTIGHARAQCQAARTKLDAFRSTGGAKWESFKTGIESAYGEIEATFKKLGRPTPSEPTTGKAQP
jgi:hypothetical protein